MFQPTTFGKYFLTRRIAVGGMAEVYAAKLYGADGFEKDLVIKQILPQYAKDPEFVQSFVAEAKIVVTLNHANIVSIYELGRVDGTYFIAMEYVDGMDAFNLLEAARRHGENVDPGLAILIVEEAAKGLDYAHRRKGPDGHPLGLVHRDLNPRNVLVSKEGDVKILDFGIAKTNYEAAGMPKTRAGVVKGTTGYMSPEQAAGYPIDYRTDIYQAGLLLHELLTGEALFWRPDDEETRNRMRAHRVVTPSSVRKDITSDLDRVVLEALKRDPNQRIATASDLVVRLAQVRFAQYSHATPQRLGALVSTLVAKDAAAVAETVEELPNTFDLSEVISRAIEQSMTGSIETIARGPGLGDGGIPSENSEPNLHASGQFRAARPRGDSIPPWAASYPQGANGPIPVVQGQLPPVPKHPSSSNPAPNVILTSDGELVATESTDSADIPISTAIPVLTNASPQEQATKASDRRKAKVWIWGLLGAVLLGVLAFATIRLMVANKPPPKPTSKTQPPNHPTPLPKPAPHPASSIETEAMAEAPALEKSASLTARPKPSKATPSASEAPKSRVAPRPVPEPATMATVAFGTRSCSSRVSVDGRVVTRSTPSYGHQLSAGTHRVVVEGITCPLVEDPGSLRQTMPRISDKIEVLPGRKHRVIADFDQGLLLVRSSVDASRPARD